MHALCTLAMAGAKAIGARIAASDDEHALAGSENIVCRIERVALITTILLRQKLHGEVNALELAARDVEVARVLGPAAKQDSVVVLGERVHGDVDADVSVREEGDALGLHLRNAPIDDVLLKLEVGDAIAEQPADAVVLFVHRNRVASAAKLLRGRES